MAVGRAHYNYYRDYDPALGRYVESDPIGLKGGASTFAYANLRPLLNRDPFGLKSRVCCRRLNDTLAKLSSIYDPRHCYLETDNATGNTTFGLLGGPLSSGMAFGVGQTFINNKGFDFGGDCGEWNEGCGTDKCVKDTATGYPNPTEYGGTTSNSNTFAGTVARKCGLQRPVGPFATPGWGDPPASPARGYPQVPINSPPLPLRPVPQDPFQSGGG